MSSYTTENIKNKRDAIYQELIKIHKLLNTTKIISKEIKKSAMTIYEISHELQLLED